MTTELLDKLNDDEEFDQLLDKYNELYEACTTVEFLETLDNNSKFKTYTNIPDLDIQVRYVKYILFSDIAVALLAQSFDVKSNAPIKSINHYFYSYKTAPKFALPHDNQPEIQLLREPIIRTSTLPNERVEGGTVYFYLLAADNILIKNWLYSYKSFLHAPIEISCLLLDLKRPVLTKPSESCSIRSLIRDKLRELFNKYE